MRLSDVADLMTEIDMKMFSNCIQNLTKKDKSACL